MRQHVITVGTDGRRYEIVTLTPELARTFSSQLLALHNLIPHVTWTEEELFAEMDRCNGREYRGKWSLSLCALHGGEPVALLVAYLRNDNVRRQQPGLYIHRLAVAPQHQRNRLGTQMTQAAVDAYFATVPGLKVITVQTNDEVDNRGVIEFYRSLGFKDYSKVEYRDKQDLLLRMRPPLALGPLRLRPPHRRAETEACLNRSAAFIEHLSELLAPPPPTPAGLVSRCRAGVREWWRRRPR